ncbi:vitamin K epoxide reductase family protein [Chloroflexia bacterium SDU3-3]|nr:vitamin K epoxide reductase family protein [Chloroflexia bacterium SDU3-3]
MSAVSEQRGTTMRQFAVQKIAIVLFALVGLFDALYLSINRLTASHLACPTSGGCEAVQASPHAVFFGVPVAFIGVAGYAALLLLALLSLANFSRGPLSARAVLAVVATLGVLFSAYLVYLQLAVIHAICFWCMLSASMELGIALLAWLDLRWSRYEPPPLDELAVG